MLSHLVNKPETRKILEKTLSDFYDEIDFDILEKINIEHQSSTDSSKKRRRNAFHNKKHQKEIPKVHK